VVSTAELVGTELLRANLSALVGPSVCQITVISASQYRACVLLVYVEGWWFPP
jgi:hypothetical protein